MTEAEELLNAWVETVQDYAILLMDPVGNVASWNRGAARLLGYSETEAIGRPSSFIFTPEDIAAGVPERELGKALATGRASDDRWHVRKDGSRFWGSGIVTLLQAEDGKPRGFVKAFRDLTDRKRLEEELRRQSEQLREADRRKNEFLAMLSHELRNPLAPILNSLYVLRAFWSETPHLQQAGEIIDRQILHMKRLIDDLLEVARVVTHKVRLSKQRVAVGEILKNSLGDVRPLIAERRHDLLLSLDATAGVILDADGVRLAQIFSNLLTNAAKYTEPGGTIWVTGQCDRDGDLVVISIKDTGIGIAPDFLPHVFDLFRQADQSLARSQGGLGIGLSLVRALAEVHGGTVEARSQGLGHGSEFIVTLPTAGRAADGTDTTTAEVGAADRPIRILIVDDNADAPPGGS